MAATTLNKRTITVLALCLAAVAVIWLAASFVAYEYAGSQAPLQFRVATARFAASARPWDSAFRARALQLRGETQLAAGDYNAAVTTLEQAYRLDLENDRLLALFKRAQAIRTAETDKKAHLQHGHEGPGGTLRPEDIER